MSQAYLQELKVVDPAYRECDTANIDPNWTQIPEHCTKCGADMKVKKGWQPSEYDNKTGQASGYQATVVCSKRWGFYLIGNVISHDEKLLCYTPPSFNRLINRGKKKPVAHLTVLERRWY